MRIIEEWERLDQRVIDDAVKHSVDVFALLWLLKAVISNSHVQHPTESVRLYDQQLWGK